MSSQSVNSVKIIWRIALHELLIAFKTRRILGVLFLYSTVSVMGSYAYVAILKAMEEQSTQFLINSGVDASKAGQAVSVMGGETYQKVLALFAGAQPEQLSNAIMSSPFIPVILLASFAFLPTLILLLAYDIVVAEVETRTICYSLLRATRAQLFLGKLFSQSIILLLLNTLMLVLLLVMSLNMIGSTSASQTVLGIFRVWLCLIPYGLCYLAMILFASSMSNKRRGTLTLSIIILSTFQVFSWLRHLPEEGFWGVIKMLHWLSPSQYADGLWLSGLSAPLTSAGILLTFTVGFSILSILRLKGRDL